MSKVQLLVIDFAVWSNRSVFVGIENCNLQQIITYTVYRISKELFQ